MSDDKPLPTSYYPSILISSDNNILYAIDPNTGKKNWQKTMPVTYFTGTLAVFKTSPLLYNQSIYVVRDATDSIMKVDARDGSTIKTFCVATPNPGGNPNPVPPFNVVGTPIADGKLMYVPTISGTIYAFDTGTGIVAWQYTAASALVASPTIYNGNIYIATTGGHVTCLNKTTGPDVGGNPIWDYPGSYPLAPGLNPSFISSPSICPPYLYVGGALDSNMYCIYLTPPASFLTSYPYTDSLRFTFKTKGNIFSSPATGHQRCVFGSTDFNVYCIDTLAQNVWTPRPTSSKVNSSPIIDNQTIYVGSDDYNIYAINMLNGTIKWHCTTQGLIKSSPLVYQGTVFVGSYDGYLYAVDSAQGNLKWRYPITGNIQCSPTIDDYTGTQYNSGISGYTN